jgi:hypothetical protein
VVLNQQTRMLALFLVLAAVLVTGLVAVPVLEEAAAQQGNVTNATNATSSLGNATSAQNLTDQTKLKAKGWEEG